MISFVDLYHVVSGVVPLYAAMLLAYTSVKHWHIFTPDQCSGINRFVALFAVPLLSFHFISSNNPFSMHLRFLAADTLQKLLVLAALAAWSALRPSPPLAWPITLFSLSTLPNTLVLGIPLLQAMYGPFSASLMVQLVVLQCVLWYTLLLFLFEFRAARLLIADHFPGAGAGIVSVALAPDVLSFHAAALETDAGVNEDGTMRLTVRRSTASPRPSNLTNAEIYSLQSSRNPTPRPSSFNYGNTPRPSNFQEDKNVRSILFGNNGNVEEKDLHMFVWSSTASPVSDVYGNNQDCCNFPAAAAGENVKGDSRKEEFLERQDFSFGNGGAMGEIGVEGGAEEEKMQEGGGARIGGEAAALGLAAMPPTSVMTRLILIMVWRKLIRNPNTYSSLLGIIWSLVSYG